MKKTEFDLDGFFEKQMSRELRVDALLNELRLAIDKDRPIVNEIEGLLFRLANEVYRTNKDTPQDELVFSRQGALTCEAARILMKFGDLSQEKIKNKSNFRNGCYPGEEAVRKNNALSIAMKAHSLVVQKVIGTIVRLDAISYFAKHPLLEDIAYWLSKQENQIRKPNEVHTIYKFLEAALKHIHLKRIEKGEQHLVRSLSVKNEKTFRENIAKAYVYALSSEELEMTRSASSLIAAQLIEVIPYFAPVVWLECRGLNKEESRAFDELMLIVHNPPKHCTFQDLTSILSPRLHNERYFAVFYQLWPYWVEAHAKQP